MKILSKYFSRQIFSSFVGFGVVLAGLAWMIQILLLMKLIVKYGINVGDFIGMSMYTIPLLVSIIIPFVMFISVTFVYNKMISNNEITVCMASGQSPFSIAKPAIIIGAVIMALHLVGNVWVVPKSQDRFYGTQWELRYGLGHLKIREAAFNQMMNNVVVYVERVNKKDIMGLTLRDGRQAGKERIITSEKGKFVNTPKGLTIVTGTGGLQMSGKTGVVIGTFDGAEMDMEMSDSVEAKSSKARRVETSELIAMLGNLDDFSPRQAQKIMAEVATRFLAPPMDLLLVLIALACLLRMSALRRGPSYAALVASFAMIAAEVAFMSLSTSITAPSGILYLAAGELVLILGMFWYLKK
jgi:lipopolysaccharide export system permease protein